ncbi:GDSL-type esterase/lipase family protein [Streptomyces fructofermentans]|uniref:SGNH hydrolase-type esterase domain-containing protein n=1 Tax=Streptomyces fructofermentans TaxID=152141 RepID=A0A918U1Z5_9ACTN|nr:GDSL-type esterase/lipase family protein [Streptomyces fructofermentans]GGX82815.1 hypothetical protein GCM10010515_58030 [Streptomyces fructofermentans]
MGPWLTVNELRPHALFSFGTLTHAPVQAALFGRAVPSSPASLAGYRTRPLTITDPFVIAASGLDVHMTLECRLGGTVDGALLRLTDQDLAAADAYEVDDYVRRRVRLSSGEPAWAYVDAKPLRPAARIAILGDGIAYGRCDPHGGWAARLAADHIARNENEHRVFNLAVPGSTLRGVAEQVSTLLAPRRPDTVLVAAGMNDSSLPLAANRRDGLQHMAEHLDVIAASIEGHGARLVVMGPTWIDETRTLDHEGARYTEARVTVLRELLQVWCDDNHVDRLDMWEPLRGDPALLDDGLHPTPEGHRKLYHHLRALSR